MMPEALSFFFVTPSALTLDSTFHVAKTDSFSSLSIPQLIIFRQVGL
jgi:hypothetical protein